MSRTTRRWLGLAAGLLGVALVALTLRFGPAIALTLGLALPATEAWLSPVLPDVARQDVVFWPLKPA